MRAERERTHLPSVALAGYTNAGKSTLLNALTGATIGVRDRLFHTLDPTTRVMHAGGRDYLLTDTVGFIRKLPHQLVDAFGATLEETRLADLILHVVDASVDEDELRRDDPRGRGRAAGDRRRRRCPQLLVLSKADRIDEERRTELQHRHRDARAGVGRDRRGHRGARAADRGGVRADAARDVELLIPYDEGGRLAELHEIAGDLEREETPEGVKVVARLPARWPRRYEPFALSGPSAMSLRVRRVDPRAVLPTRAYAGDAGLDLYALDDAVLGPGERASVRTGIAVEIPDGQAGLVLPRSGLASTPRDLRGQRPRPDRRRLPRRGPACCCSTPTATTPFSIAAGDRIAQLVIVSVHTPQVVEVQELALSERGSGGFGSSGS